MRWLAVAGRAVVDDSVELHLERPGARNELVVEVAQVDDADRDDGRVLRAAAAVAEVLLGAALDDRLEVAEVAQVVGLLDADLVHRHAVRRATEAEDRLALQLKALVDAVEVVVREVAQRQCPNLDAVHLAEGVDGVLDHGRRD
eukprot:7390580-Prymnesium_polylepis.3